MASESFTVTAKPQQHLRLLLLKHFPGSSSDLPQNKGVWLVLTASLWSQHCFQVNLGNCPGMNCFHGGSQETFQEAPLLQRQSVGMEKEEEFAHFLLRRIFVSDACKACSLVTFFGGLFNPIFSPTISSSATRPHHFSFLQDLPQIQNNFVIALALDPGLRI